jgi:thiol:disulfide interchange protein DsbD
MKKILFVLFMCIGAGLINSSWAQMTPDPTHWTYEVKKKSGDQYELIFHLKLEDKWHIWSVKPGGDGYEIPPSFKFNDHSGIKTIGTIKEMGKPITETMDGVDGAVTFYSGGVDYVQTISLKGKGKVTGSHEYQVCNDRMCLPPKTKQFEFDIK